MKHTEEMSITFRIEGVDEAEKHAHFMQLLADMHQSMFNDRDYRFKNKGSVPGVGTWSYVTEANEVELNVGDRIKHRKRSLGRGTILAISHTGKQASIEWDKIPYNPREYYPVSLLMKIGR